MLSLPSKNGCAEFNEFKYIMKKADPQAFITISENVHIIGRFVETEE